mmetsp:Transcript_24278/g.69995  ORF Transcript_24278/g.69995 Transcript_24278/m.69995 type:complete len:118 (-) Transcript_24278:179-532(-)
MNDWLLAWLADSWADYFGWLVGREGEMEGGSVFFVKLAVSFVWFGWSAARPCMTRRARTRRVPMADWLAGWLAAARTTYLTWESWSQEEGIARDWEAGGLKQYMQDGWQGGRFIRRE